MSKPILYSFWRSSCSWRIRIALHLKNIDYEIRTVDIAKKRLQLTDEFRSINPIQKVPALIIDGNTLIESMNIMNYLDENFPGTHPLLPQDKVLKIKVREMSEIIVSGIQPLQNIGIRQISLLSDEKDFMKFVRHWIKKGLFALETVAKTTAGEYCVGNEITMADCCLFPQIYNARKYKVDTREYPILEKVCSRLEIQPAFFLTHPDTQPDAPQRN